MMIPLARAPILNCEISDKVCLHSLVVLEIYSPFVSVLVLFWLTTPLTGGKAYYTSPTKAVEMAMGCSSTSDIFNPNMAL